MFAKLNKRISIEARAPLSALITFVMEELIFCGHSLEIFKREGKFFVRYDSGGIVIHIIEKEITEEEAIKAPKSSNDAYEMIIERERRLKAII